MRHPSRVAVLAVAATLAVTGCGAIDRAEQAARSGSDVPDANMLTVAVFGGSWGEAVQKAIIAPFEQKTGITVRQEVGTSTVTVGRLRQQPDAVDVALIDSGVSEIARAEGLVTTIPEGKLANLDQLDERAKHRDDEGLWAVTMGFWALGIAYNTEEVAQPPDSWEDLWDPRLAGKVAIPTPDTTGGLPLLVQAAQQAGGSAERVEPGFGKLAELDAAAYFDSSGTASNLLQSGEATAIAHYNAGTWPLADQGLPISWVAPEEGALAADSRWHLTSKTGNRDLALRFIDFASTKAAQEGLARELYVAPANTGARVTGQARARMPYGEHGSLDDLVFPDWQAINEHRQEWTDQWNRKVAG